MSQPDAILAWLKAGHCLDPLTALGKFGTNRLAARICELRQAGYKIRTEPTKVTKRDGSSARVAVYKLVAE